MAKTVTYTSGTQYITDPSQVDSDKIRLAGTASATAPTLNLESSLPPFTYALGKVEVRGTGAVPNFGAVESYYARVIFTRGVHVSHGTLATNSQTGFTFEGNSVVTDGSTFIAYGGRYHSAANTLNGSVSVGKDSTANFNDVHLVGEGTVRTTAKSATIDVAGPGNDGVDAGIHVDLTKGGVLNISGGMQFLGQIDMGRSATVNVNSRSFSNPPQSLGAVAEVWHSATDLLELLNTGGQDVARIGFANGTPELYAAPNATGGVAITEHFAAGDLPVTVVPS